MIAKQITTQCRGKKRWWLSPWPFIFEIWRSFVVLYPISTFFNNLNAHGCCKGTVSKLENLTIFVSCNESIFLTHKGYFDPTMLNNSLHRHRSTNLSIYQTILSTLILLLGDQPSDFNAPIFSLVSSNLVPMSELSNGKISCTNITPHNFRSVSI